jgi:hypothetical protein
MQNLRAVLTTLSIFCVLSLLIANPSLVSAAEVGRFTQVIGQVNLFKQGNPPAKTVKPQDGIEPSDIIETQPNSKATIKFVDDSDIVVSPGSRLKIEEFAVDGKKGVRKAVFFFFQGVMRFTVNRLFNLKEPDFIIKSSVAVLGVRGTDGVIIGIDRSQQKAFYLYTLQGVVMLATSIEELLFARGVNVRSLQANQVILGQPISKVNLPITQAQLATLGGLVSQGLPLGVSVPVGTNATGLLQNFPEIIGEPLKEAPPAKLMAPGDPAADPATGDPAADPALEPPAQPLLLDSTRDTTLGSGVSSASQ